MGRSVMTAENSLQEIYLAFDNTDRWAYEDFKRDIVRTLKQEIPTLREPARDEWSRRECLLIAENGHMKVYLSTYASIAAVSLVARQGTNHEALSEVYIYENWMDWRQAFVDAYFKVYWRGGTMSNGVSVFHHIEREAES